MRSKSPKVQGLQGPGVPGSQGPRYLKLTFKHELDCKEGPSFFLIFPHSMFHFRAQVDGSSSVTM